MSRDRTSMSEFFGSVWWMIVSLGVLVTFHEFGHYWVARRCGVKVLRFSVGFGKPLWSRRGTRRHRVRDRRDSAGRLRQDARRSAKATSPPAELSRRPSTGNRCGKRIAIVAAGPIANLLLCVALLWAMFVIGRPDYAPVSARSRASPRKPDLRSGDTVLAVGDRETPTWSEAQLALTHRGAGSSRRAGARARPPTATDAVRAAARCRRLPQDFDEPRTSVRSSASRRATGWCRRWSDACTRTRPAWGVLAEGDRITAIDGEPVAAFDDIGPLVQTLGRARRQRPWSKSNATASAWRCEIKPRGCATPDGKDYWALGIACPPKRELPRLRCDTALRPAGGDPGGASRNRQAQAGDSFAMIDAHVDRPRLGREHVSGPITIARAANAYAPARAGLVPVTCSPCCRSAWRILNLLPIPILDGGHLLYYLIELVKGSPVSERAMAAGQYVGLAMLAGLMGLAFYNDILQPGALMPAAPAVQKPFDRRPTPAIRALMAQRTQPDVTDDATPHPPPACPRPRLGARSSRLVAGKPSIRRPPRQHPVDRAPPDRRQQLHRHRHPHRRPAAHLRRHRVHLPADRARRHRRFARTSGEAIRALYKTGFFEDVQARPPGRHPGGHRDRAPGDQQARR